jgi:ubiquinone/menaquinone biosynthesis C-methylase UbiE
MDLQLIAKNLRQPEGEMGLQVGEKMNTGNDFINRLTIQKLNAQPHDKVLEIGMGNGFFVKDVLASYPSITYVGCDFSATMIGAAKQLNKEIVDRGEAQFILSNADMLPFSDSTFDSVFTINTIYFWEDPARELKEIRRVLKPTGQFTISIRPEDIMRSLPFVKYGFTLYTREALIMCLQENFFTPVNVWEVNEPAQEIGGTSVKMMSLIIQCNISNLA